MNAIVAVDKNWAIGFAGQLLLPISEDLKRFKKLTMGRTLIYGRKTLATFPGGKPLPKRRNMMLTTHPELYHMDDLEVYATIDSLLEQIDPEEMERVSVIGGDSVFRQFLPKCDRVLVTKIDYAFPEADTYFPDLNTDPAWQLTEVEPWLLDEASRHRFRYLLYEKVGSDGQETEI